MPSEIIKGVVGIGGALLGDSAQKKASAQAAETQNNATAAQLQLGQQSLAQNQAIYNSNYDMLSPFVSRGNVAGEAMNSLLGLGAAPKMTNPLSAPAPAAATGYGGSPTGNAAPAYSGASTGGEHIYANSSAPVPAAASGARPLLSDYRGNISGFQDALQGYRAAHPIGSAATPPAAGAPATGAPAASGATGARSALNNFANSAGMQFQLAQGADMINNRYAGAGALQSGAAMKALQNYGQQTALNNYFMPYMGLLGGQQAVGAQAGSAVAGVGSNFGNTAAGINGQMGNAINSGAQNIGNLQLANGQNQANMYGQIGSSLGNFASSFGGMGGAQIPHFVQGTQLPVNF